MAGETEMPTDLVLVRHGESEGNLYDDLLRKGKEVGEVNLALELQAKLHGRHSSEWRLTDLGRHQAKRAGRLVQSEILDRGLGSFDRYFCSSYARAMETAGEMNLRSARYQISVFLREKDSKKEWKRGGVDFHLEAKKSDESLSHNQVRHSASSITKFYGDAAGLESPADLLMRIQLFLDHLRRQCSGQRVMVVCHNHVMKAFRILLTDIHPVDIEKTWEEVTPNCCIEWYTRRDAKGDVQPLFARRIVIALKNPKDPRADHCQAERGDFLLRQSATDHELTADQLKAAVERYPQSLNNTDMAALIAGTTETKAPAADVAGDTVILDTKACRRKMTI